MTWRVALLAMVVLTAGCIGLGDDGEDAEPASEDGPDEMDEDTPEDGAAASEASGLTWENETYEGSVTGVTLPGAGSLTVAPLSENNAISFTTTDGVETVVLNLTADGGALQMNIAPPGCESGTAGAACEESVTTEGGEAQYTNASAEPGEWGVTFFAGEPAAAQVSYTLDVTQGVQASAS